MKMVHLLPILLLALLMAALASAADVGVYRLPPEAREALVDLKATVYHGRINGDFVAELTLAEVEYLHNRGFEAVKLFDSVAEKDAFTRQQDDVDILHTYDQMRSDFNTLATTYPNIASFQHFGTSVQNRELFGLKITDNPQVEEDEPEVAFWGCIHGNEYAYAEMSYLYAHYLCQNYGIDPNVTAYVDNDEIWCIPLINPDGRVNGTRNNANNIDLNRDFGYNWDGWGSSPYPFSQVESRTVREFCINNNVTISISFHCSGDEFYYPWGFFPHNAPDYAVLTRVGSRYANLAAYGFMSSYASYQTHGEILDWAYGCLGGLSYTAEVSSSSSGVETTFNRNRPGMNLYCYLAQEGLHGLVTDSQTGAPLWAAVWIQGNPIPSYTDPEVGDVHRIVLSGTYNLTVWANGYSPQTLNGVQVAFGAPGQFQAELNPGAGEYAFMVVSANQHDPNNSYNNVTYPAWALGAPDNIPCSLGASGFIGLDMGPDHEIMDGPGFDFTVTEAILPRDPTPEIYSVYAGNAYVQNTLIGSATGTASFDLGAAGVSSTRYLKIVDASGSNPDLPLAGMDLDGITVLNSLDNTTAAVLTEAFIPADVSLSTYPNPFN
ncbi:MAG: M14 family zinc carboxypeptidase, partial [bacterium]